MLKSVPIILALILALSGCAHQNPWWWHAPTDGGYEDATRVPPPREGDIIIYIPGPDTPPWDMPPKDDEDEDESFWDIFKDDKKDKGDDLYPWYDKNKGETHKDDWPWREKDDNKKATSDDWIEHYDLER